MRPSNWLLALFVVLCLAYSHAKLAKKGATTVGVILPIHDAGSEPGQCGNVSLKGVAMMIAIRLASDQHASSGKHSIGYDIRDSCGSISNSKDIAYEFNINKRSTSLSKQGNSSVKVAAVISPFALKDLPVVRLLSLEEIPQFSYYQLNARLQVASEAVLKELSLLYSTYPEEISKMQVVADLLETYHWQYVNVIASDTIRGRSGVRLLKSSLMAIEETKRPCYKDYLVKATEYSVNKTLHAISQNPLITVIVLFCDPVIDQMIFEAAGRFNLTNVTWISTTDWQSELTTIQQFASTVDGMLVVGNPKSKSTEFLKAIYSLSPPFQSHDIVKEAFVLSGGDSNCPSAGGPSEASCKDALAKMKSQLGMFTEEASYAMDAVFGIQKIVQQMNTKNQTDKSPVEELANLDAENPLTGHMIKFSSNNVVMASSFDIYNFKGNQTNSSTLVQYGSWKLQGVPRLRLNKKEILWKSGQSIVPSSRCSLDCKPGTYRSYPVDDSTKCCWECVTCDGDSMSNITNGDVCQPCSQGHVATPDHMKCIKYQVEYFRWYRPAGEFLLVLVTAGLCLTLFTLGIFSQNSESEVVETGCYKVLVTTLLGVALCFLCVIPLLLEPRVTVCNMFVGLFTASLTIPLSIMMTKISTVNDYFYDEDGDVTKTTLGPKPRLVIILVLCFIQLALMIGATVYRSPQVLISDTAQWNFKYVQCECQTNLPLWIGIVYNISLCLILTALSCSAVKMDDNFGELQHICVTVCMLFLDFFIFLAVTFGVEHEQMTMAMGVLSCLFGLSFLGLYFIPKLKLILCRKEKVIVPEGSQPLLAVTQEEEESKPVEKATAIGASPGTKRRLLQARVK